MLTNYKKYCIINLSKEERRKKKMKKIIYLLLIIISLVIIGKMGILNEPEELEKTRSNYSNIYGDKASSFVFSK